MLLVMYMAWMISLGDAPARPHGDAHATSARPIAPPTARLTAERPPERRLSAIDGLTRRPFTGLAR